MEAKKNPIFKSKESIFTFGFVSFEAVVISILEGIVIMNHLGLVQNCDPDSAGEGLCTPQYYSENLRIVY